MFLRKMFYVFAGFAMGAIISGVFFSSQVWAQYGMGGSKDYAEDELASTIPAKYGKLVAISGVNLYFQAENGTIYILKQRTSSSLDPQVTVIKRGE